MLSPHLHLAGRKLALKITLLVRHCNQAVMSQRTVKDILLTCYWPEEGKAWRLCTHTNMQL